MREIESSGSGTTTQQTDITVISNLARKLPCWEETVAMAIVASLIQCSVPQHGNMYPGRESCNLQVSQVQRGRDKAQNQIFCQRQNDAASRHSPGKLKLLVGATAHDSGLRGLSLQPLLRAAERPQLAELTPHLGLDIFDSSRAMGDRDGRGVGTTCVVLQRINVLRRDHHVHGIVRTQATLRHGLHGVPETVCHGLAHSRNPLVSQKLTLSVCLCGLLNATRRQCELGFVPLG